MFKDTPNGQTNYYVSKCCNQQVRIDDGYTTCIGCGEKCVTVLANK